MDDEILVVVGVETLDDVDIDEDVDIEDDVDTLDEDDILDVDDIDDVDTELDVETLVLDMDDDELEEQGLSHSLVWLTHFFPLKY